MKSFADSLNAVLISLEIIKSGTYFSELKDEDPFLKMKKIRFTAAVNTLFIDDFGRSLSYISFIFF